MGKGSSTTPYRRQKSSIRLLCLELHDDTHLLSCKPEGYGFNGDQYDCKLTPPYFALSYEWGDNETQVESLINGRCSTVSQNLWLFLSVLKSRQTHIEFPADIRLWIDAICMNQNDVTERNAQVWIMGSIYQQVGSVLAWLGWPQGWHPRVVFGFISEGSWAGQQIDTMLY